MQRGTVWPGWLPLYIQTGAEIHVVLVHQIVFLHIKQNMNPVQDQDGLTQYSEPKISLSMDWKNMEKTRLLYNHNDKDYNLLFQLMCRLIYSEPIDDS